MRNLLAGAGLAVLLAGAATAQQMPPPPGAMGGPPPQPMLPLKRADVPAMVARHFAMLDANHDGALTESDRQMRRDQHRAEMVEGMKRHRDEAFAAMDANKDGQISRQEFDNAAPPPPPPGGPGMRHGMRGGGMGFGMIGGRMLEKADANHDGKVTLAEAQATALQMFDKADVNHDGVLDRDEMMVAMRERMGGEGSTMPHHHPGHDTPEMPPPPGK